MSELPSAYFETLFCFEAGMPTGNFAIITACNPMDLRYSARMNATRDHRLRRLLERRLLAHKRATGGSPNGRHQEPGWAVTTDLHAAVAIGRRFRQRAIWWIEDGELHLVSCFDDSRSKLGPIADRIR